MERKRVKHLIHKHGTNDPLKLIESMGLLLLREKLGVNTWGYYTNVCRTPCIHLNSALEEHLQRYVAAHELGHHILHKGVSTPFLRANTLQSIDKIECQANRFAVELLIPDKLLLEGRTLYDTATICGVPEEVIHLKQTPKISFMSSEESYFKL